MEKLQCICFLGRYCLKGAGLREGILVCGKLSWPNTALQPTSSRCGLPRLSLVVERLLSGYCDRPLLAVNRPPVSRCRYESAQQLPAWHLLCVFFSENISRCQHREGEAPLYMKRFRLPASLYRKQGRPIFRLQTIPAESQEAYLCSRPYLICRFSPHFRIRQNPLGFHFSDGFSSQTVPVH